jgi:hypothetical protein
MFALVGSIVGVVMLGIPLVANAHAPIAEPTQTDQRWEFTLDGRGGFPTGYLRVGEFPTGANKLSGMGGSPGTTLRLHEVRF